MQKISNYLNNFKYRYVFLNYIFRKNISKKYIKNFFFRNVGSLKPLKFMLFKNYKSFLRVFFIFEIFYSRFAFKGYSTTICFKSNDFLTTFKTKTVEENAAFIFEDKRFLELFYSISIGVTFLRRYRFLNRFFGSQIKMLELLEIYGYSPLVYFKFFSLAIYLFSYFIYDLLCAVLYSFFHFLILLNGFVQAIGKRVS